VFAPRAAWATGCFVNWRNARPFSPNVPRLSHGCRELSVARSLDGKVHMRCANGYRLETRSMRKCVYRKQLDLETLVCTRGPNFPVSRLESSPGLTPINYRRPTRIERRRRS
jgi:hypothetical protein